MNKNQVVYAVTHGEITKAMLIAINDRIGTAYVKINGATQRVTSDSVVPTYQMAKCLLGGAAC